MARESTPLSAGTGGAPLPDEGVARARQVASRTRSMVRGFLRAVARRWLILVLAILAWQALTSVRDYLFFPRPSEIALRMQELWFSGPPAHAFLSGAVLDDIGTSLGRALGGWAIATILGVAVGVTLGRSRRAYDYAHLLLEFGRATPSSALVPVFLVLFGIGTRMQLATIAFGCFWPILLNAADGARSVDRTHLDTARVFRVPPVRRLFRIVLPAASPKIFAALRISLSIALILMVISEMVGSTRGIGHHLIDARQTFEYADIWAGIVLLGFLGYVLNVALLGTEQRLLGWHRGDRRLDE